MARYALITFVAFCFFGAGMGSAQPARVPASALETPTAHPYIWALGAVANYQSCGVNARRASVLALNAELRSIEAAAEAKGLGPVLERLRKAYEALMAVADVMACAPDPDRALADARRSLARFRTWVAGQHARR